MNSQYVHDAARIEAAKNWNARACGELAGSKDSLEYFARVEANRYGQQAWQKDYFRFPEFAGKKVLEIGTGQGSDLLQFGRAGAECHGIDISENHVELTRRNFELNRIPVDIRNSDAVRIPFADATFDCVYSFGVIHHIPDAEKVLAEVRRVLKPGGVLMIALYYKWSAFHLCSKIVADGLLHGWLFSKGYHGLLATIEEGADGNKIKPYVRLYSKTDLARLVGSFKINDLSVHQLDSSHFSPFSRVFRWLFPESLVRKLDHRLGWYVVCKAER